MAITHATSTGPIGETQWLENHTVDAAALRTALNVADGATANATDAALRDRATHTGTQAASTITGLASVATTGAYSDLTGTPSIPAALADLDTTVTGAQLNADHAKLGLIENGATADQSAAEVPVTLTATSYTAATPNVEAHLNGINTALGSLGGGHDAVTVTDSSSIDFTLTGQALTAVVLPAGVNHDALSGFVANEHIDWTTDQGATNLHASNIPDLSATYSVVAHNHEDVYEPADASILKDADIGSAVAAQSHTHATLINADQKAALDAANAPSAGNAFATMSDIGGGGTVMSVGISGSDGIEVDSGSPVTASGTIALGVNATELRTHINVESGATANATDAALRDRATHTGSQAASTITGLVAVATSGAYSDLTGTPSIPDALADLDTTVTGAQLNTDHAKLALIEDEATSDQSAAEVPVALTATNYNASTADVESHLTGINTALGSVGTVEGATNALTFTGSNGIGVSAVSTGANSATVAITIDASSLPTTDPATAGQVWNDAGILKVSAG